MASESRLLKCVVWDLDNTLWPGIAAEDESSHSPQPDPEMLRLIGALEERGIVSSVASRNDPSVKSRLLGHPALADKFVYPQVGWEPKSDAVKRIAASLNVSLDAVAFVDDSDFERAEVAYMLPQVLTLAPEEARAFFAEPQFSAHAITAEGRGRAAMYRAEERRRDAEKQFGGSRSEFLKWCGMRLQIAPALHSDLARIAELTMRTHQLNSTGRRYSSEEIEERIRGERWLVPAVRLHDRFGDYGMVGAAVVDCEPPHHVRTWLAELVMLSCRVEGRGIPAALLRWVMGQALDAGKDALRAVYVVNEQNLPVRLLFKQTGFAVVERGEMVVVERNLHDPLPPYPEWLTINTSEVASA